MITVVILIPWFHPAYKAGGPIQSIANLVNQFYQNISYKIICSNKDLDATVLQVIPDCWIDYNDHTKVWYSSKKSILHLIKEINIDEKNILFINGIYSWQFNLMPLLFSIASKKIVSARGMLHPGALSQKSLKKKIYLSFWKVFNLHNRCTFHASNQDEKKYIQHVFGEKPKIFVAQNFPREFALQKFPEKKVDYLCMISIALVSAMKNYLQVIKALSNCEANIVYNIYGPIKDEAYWNLCTDQINNLPKNIIVKYNGDVVPAEVENALAKNHVFILPSKSENFGHAIYEALTAGRPVITSHNTPWNNLAQSYAGINANAENINDLQNAINFFAKMNTPEFAAWNIGAAKYAEDAINIENIKDQYQHMFSIN